MMNLINTAVFQNICDALDELDGEEVACIHNSLCSRKIKYLSDNFWEYTGEDDNDEAHVIILYDGDGEDDNDEAVVDSDGCLRDNDGDAETDME